MIGLFLLTLAGLTGVTWWSLLKAKEQARTAASKACREHGLLLMDDTVMLDSVQLKKENNSRAWKLRYRFDFARDGVLHKEGIVLIAPGQRAVVSITTSSGQVIQEM